MFKERDFLLNFKTQKRKRKTKTAGETYPGRQKGKS